MLAEFHVHHARGRPDRTILRLVDNLEVDILVMGTVVRTGIPGFVIGNTMRTEACLRFRLCETARRRVQVRQHRLRWLVVPGRPRARCRDLFLLHDWRRQYALTGDTKPFGFKASNAHGTRQPTATSTRSQRAHRSDRAILPFAPAFADRYKPSLMVRSSAPVDPPTRLRGGPAP